MSKSALSRRVRAVLAAAVAVAGLPFVGAGTAGAAVGSAVRLIGHDVDGHAGLYGWGATTMKDGSVLIGDYWNRRVVRFAKNGTPLGTFINNAGFGPNQHQSPYGLGTDPRNGDIYMADTDRRGIDKYDSTGRFLLTFGTGGQGPGKFEYPSRVVVASDGSVFVVDTWSNRISVHDPGGRERFEFGSFGAGTGQWKQPHGVGFDAADRLFVTDNGNKRILVFDTSGRFLFTFGAGRFGGDLRGLAVDKARGWVYVVDAEGNRIHKFTTGGTHLKSWGGKGTGPGQFYDGGREATVDGDGNLWVGDMANFRVQKFSPEGAFLLQRPEPEEPPAEGGLNGPRGVAVDSAGNVFVTDTYNWRVQKLSPTGKPLAVWGRRGRGNSDFNYARMLAVDPRNGDVVVADTDNHRIVKFSNDGTFRWKVGGLGSGPTTFKNPHGIDIGPDGTIYLADTRNKRVVVLSANGDHIRSFGSDGTGNGQFRHPRGVAVNPADGSIWVADSVRDDLQHFSATGQFIKKIGTRGSADHQFNGPFDVEVGGGRVYIADTVNDKVKVYTTGGQFVGAIGGSGSALGRLNRPQGLDLGAGGLLYVAEQDNERVQVFHVGDGPAPDPDPDPDPGSDSGPPDTTVSAPTHRASLPAGTVTLQGAATDDRSVASVWVAIQDRATRKWWQSDGSWGAYRKHDTTLTSPGSATTGWSFPWTPPASGGDFGFAAGAVDAAGKEDPDRPWTALSVQAADGGGTPLPGPDSEPPDTTITHPVGGATLPNASLTFAGGATDNSGVAAVRIAIQDRTTRQWWRSNGTWGAFVRHDAILGDPGAPTTGWSYTWTPPGGAGDYGILVTGFDTAGNVETDRPWTAFRIGA